MNWMLIWGIVASLVAVIAAVAWGTLFASFKQMLSDLKLAYDDYKQAMADGTITDAEKAQIADALMAALEQAVSITQVVANLVAQILAIINAATKKKAKNNKSVNTSRLKQPYEKDV